jgi:glutamine synthetase
MDTGSGAHVHFSLWKDGVNITGDALAKNKMSKDFEAFLAGVYHHYPALVHFMTP